MQLYRLSLKYGCYGAGKLGKLDEMRAMPGQEILFADPGVGDPQ